MRAAILSALFIIAHTSVARADVALPGTKRVDDSAVVRFGPEVEGYRIFLLCDGRLYQVEQETGHTVRFSAPYTHGTLPRLRAVPTGIAHNSATDAEVVATAGVVCSVGLPVHRGRDWLFNPCDGTEKLFQARIASTIEVDLVEERPVLSWPTVIVMALLSLALALGGIWLVRRLRRKSITRTTPPPGN